MTVRVKGGVLLFIWLSSLAGACKRHGDEKKDVTSFEASGDACKKMQLRSYSFDDDILPLARKYCLSCHESEDQPGKFRADRGDPVPKWQIALTSVKEGRMPPGSEKLTQCETSLLDKWLSQEIRQKTWCPLNGETVSFESHIRPLILKNCGACHGEGKNTGGFSVEDHLNIQDGQETAMVASWSRASDAVRKSTMPPASPMDECEKEALADWVERLRSQLDPKCRPEVETLNYELHIKPLARSYCYSCHQIGNASGGFRADIAENPEAGKDVRVEWGRALSAIEEGRMPPSGLKPASCELTDLKAWVSSLDSGNAGFCMMTPEDLSFQEHILPVLSKFCTSCHGANSGRLRLDVEDDVNSVLSPSERFSAALALIEKGSMPPAGPGLNDCELLTMRNWLKKLKNLASGSVCSTPPPIAPLKLRKLSNFELGNTLKEVFGDDVWQFTEAALESLPAPDRKNTFDTMSEGVTTEHVKAWLIIADSVRLYYSTYPDKIKNLDPCLSEANPSPQCVESFISTISERLQRRPMHPDRIKALAGEFFQSGMDHARIVGEILFYLLQTPEFLYHIELDYAENESNGQYPLSQFELAARISYGLTGAPPDASLREAAKRGKLEQKAEIIAEAGRMISSGKADASLRHFLQQWLHLRRFTTLNQNAHFLRGLNAATLVQDSLKSLNKFFTSLVTGGGTTRDLFTSGEVWIGSDNLSKIYGLPDRGYEVRQSLSSDRAGLLTRVGVVMQPGMATSPIQRGALIRQNILCDILGLPNPDEINDPDQQDEPGQLLTTREKWELRTGSGSCQTCHSRINPLGFAMENLDSLGRFRAFETIYSDNGIPLGELPVDAVSFPVLAHGEMASVNGASELSFHVSESEMARSCFVRMWFRYLKGQKEDGSYRCFLNSDSDGRKKGDLPIRDILYDFFIRKEFRKVSIQP